MSVQITTAMVKSYSSNVFHLAQQKESRIRMAVRMERQRSEAAFYDRIGAVEAQEKVGRHSDTTYQDTPHSRRRVTMRDYFYADLVDKEDKIRVIHTPESEYAIAGRRAMGRKIDDVIIAAALGDAFGDKEGETAIPLPDEQKLAAFDGSTTTGVGLNVETCIRLKGKFWENEADEGLIYFVVTGRQLEDMLNQEKATSSDYASVKALARGEIDTFMGIRFIRSQRLPRAGENTTYEVDGGAVGSGDGTVTAANSRRCFAFQSQGLLLAIGLDVQSFIDRMPGKHQAWQVYFSMSLGATRLEEERVVEVICHEPTS